MRSPVVLFLLLGLAFASNTPGWTENREYIYRVRGRTLTGLTEVSDQYAGILFKANLRIQPRNDGHLQALITNAEYSQIHSIISNVWQAQFPEEELSWKPLAMAEKPFQIQMENGKIVNLVVHKGIKNWEANMIKGIVSAFQMNLKGENAIQKDLNILPTPHSDNAIFVTMEDTVSGETETLYQIRPVPEYLFDQSQQGKHFDEWKQNGQILEVLKSKNFTNEQELPSYTFGFGQVEEGKPATTQMGGFYTRDFTGRAIILGSLQHYTIVNSTIIETVYVKPTVTDQQKAAVYSIIEADLTDVKSQDEKIENIAEPVQLGNLVYTYNEPELQNGEVVADPMFYQGKQQRRQYENNDNEEDSYSPAYNRLRRPRSLDEQSYYDEYYYTQDQPELTEGPRSPLVSDFNGYEGKINLNQANIEKVVEKIAKKIANELQESQKDHHETTLQRFISLTRMVRLMDYEGLKKLGDKLYTEEKQGPQQATWVSYRDAVAECGTGPALLTIQYWIESGKVTGEDAAQLISTISKSTRHPTIHYMKSFFNFCKNEKVLRQWPLNDTVINSFAHLVRVVYEDRNIQENQFPVNAFGTYQTKEGKQFVENEVIPYFSEMLQKSIQKGETHKIHAYINALGLTNHPAILATYEPYLEGKKQASEFQRVLMVLSLEKLVSRNYEVARPVLFRIYQNPGEHTSVRIAAVFQLMRSKPTLEMLQVMAQNTNIDKDQYVNSAVKQFIEQASELEEFGEFRDHCYAVKSLLNEQNYGLNHGITYLNAFIEDELNQYFQLSAQVMPSEDSYMPKGLRYNQKSMWDGITRGEIKFRGFVSSTEQLYDVARRLTKGYQQKEEQQEQHAQEQGQYPWSSQNIAKLLNMKAEEREQLEGFLALQLGVPHRMFSFDNESLSELPEWIQDLEQVLRSGKQINQIKFVHSAEMILATPTVMGIPVIYRYSSPMLIKVQGEVKAVANPSISQGELVQQPNQVKVQSQLRITVTGKSQGRVSFITPFEGQEYISGYDKHWEFNLPQIKVEANVDLKEKELQVEITPEQEHKMNIFHYRTWPYTAKTDVMDVEPLTPYSQQKNYKVIEPQNMQAFKTVIGKKYTGIALEVEVRHERKNIPADLITRIFSKNGVYNGLRQLWEDSYIQNSQFDITYRPEQSSVEKITFRSKFDKDYRQNPESRQGSWKLDDHMEPAQRQKGLMNDVAAEINNAKVMALDNVIVFHGQQKIQYLLTVAAAKSNVDPRSRVRVCFKKSSEAQEIKDYEAHLVMDNEAENTNGLDLEYSLEKEPEMNTQIEVTFGESQKQLAKVQVQVQHRRSEERKRYLKDMELYDECKEEMKEGDQSLPACTRMIMLANLLDRAEAKIQYKNIKPELEKAIEMVFDDAVIRARFNTHVDYKQSQAQENEVLINLKFHEDLEGLNATVQTPKEKIVFTNIPVEDYSRQLFIPHPVFHLRARIMSHIFGNDYYRDYCSVDQTRVNTFANRTYFADFNKEWTVMALYAPKQAREQGNDQPEESLYKQLKSQIENYVVLVRESQESQEKKDVKIVVSAPETKYQIVDIEMKPSQGQAKAKVYVNGQEVQVSKKESQDVHNGFVQVYALPNGEVKVEIYDAFYVLYDGERIRMTAVSDKLKDATRGICGQFNDKQYEDFYTSETCVARKPELFIRSFEVEGEKGKQVRQQFAGDDNQCVDIEKPLYVNVINNKDTEYDNSEEEETQGAKQGSQCMFHQTKYVQQGNKICFTTVALPSCRGHCRPSNMRTKTVGVHCVQKSDVANLWKNLIDNGSSPDFSKKAKHSTATFTIPERCN